MRTSERIIRANEVIEDCTVREVERDFFYLFCSCVCAANAGGRTDFTGPRPGADSVASRQYKGEGQRYKAKTQPSEAEIARCLKT